MSNTNYILTSYGNFIDEAELYHWGIKGMKWGVRRYQNEDALLLLPAESALKRKTRNGLKRKQRRLLPKQRKRLKENLTLMAMNFSNFQEPAHRTAS